MIIFLSHTFSWMGRAGDTIGGDTEVWDIPSLIGGVFPGLSRKPTKWRYLSTALVVLGIRKAWPLPLYPLESSFRVHVLYLPTSYGWMIFLFPGKEAGG